jgi:dihydropteroate synthase
MFWKVSNRTVDLTQRALVMGVLNVTPDSFSDGGRWGSANAAIAAGLAMAADGADILDVGGESSRPGAAPVSCEEESRRVLPVIEALASQSGAMVSVDTSKPEVAKEALRLGASVLNDITGLRQPAMRRLVRESGAGAILMHMRGTPATMQDAPVYGDVVAEVGAFLQESLHLCTEEGVAPEQILLDPGIGFGKTVQHNVLLLKNLGVLRALGRPLALGVSRKSFLGTLNGSTALEDREWPTVALTGFARSQGVALFRVHEVRANAEALRMTEAILEASA